MVPPQVKFSMLESATAAPILQPIRATHILADGPLVPQPIHCSLEVKVLFVSRIVPRRPHEDQGDGPVPFFQSSAATC